MGGSNGAARPGGIAVLLLCHRIDEELRRQFDRLRASIAATADCRLLFDAGEDPAGPQELAPRSYRFSADSLHRLGYGTYSGAGLVPGSTHYPLLLFGRDYPSYDFYWQIEYDVQFSGDWQRFFAYWQRDGSDFLTAHVRRYADEPDWHWWELRHPRRSFPLERRLRSFNPVFRLSRRALARIDAMQGEGWVGHYEVLIPSLLSVEGLKIRDFGGTGPFVRLRDRNRFYAEEGEKLRPWLRDPEGRLDRGTHRYRPIFQKVGASPEKLYHPVKPGAVVDSAPPFRPPSARRWFRGRLVAWSHRSRLGAALRALYMMAARRR